jgi:hypothetical protein
VQPELPSLSDHSLDAADDDLPQRVARVRVSIDRPVDNLHLGLSVDSKTNYFEIQFQLVAEMVVDERYIDPGLAADFPNRCIFVSALGKYSNSGPQEPIARVVRDELLSRHLNSSLKRLFKSVKRKLLHEAIERSNLRLGIYAVGLFTGIDDKSSGCFDVVAGDMKSLARVGI